MKIIRRAYTYLIALISLEVVVWGVINLLRTIFGNGLAFPSANTLSMALALVLVGVPVFAGHWLWIQKNEEDHEERSSFLRGLFFFGTFGGLFVPVAQNALALVNRTALQLFNVNLSAAFIGGSQSNIDNLIAIVVNAILGYYFYRIYTKRSEPNIRQHFTEISRLHGYLWVFYSLFFILFGLQQILRFLMVSQGEAINANGFVPLINGLSLVIIGVPLWVGFWGFRQQKDFEEDQRPSAVRLTFLFLFSFLGIIITLVSASFSVHPFLQVALRDPKGSEELISRISNPFSIGLPVAVFWYYFHKWLKRDVAAKYAASEKRGISRFYAALLGVIGFAATLAGFGFFLSVFASFLFGTSIFTAASRNQLSGSLATLLTGLPLWLVYWRELNHPEKDHALENTASITRRAYLYIAIFGTVIASMVSAIALAYDVLFGILGASGTIFGSSELTSLFLTVEFVVFAIYHWRLIREDNILLRANENQETAPNKNVLLVGYPKTISDEIIAGVTTQSPTTTIKVLTTAEFKNFSTEPGTLVFIGLDELGYTEEKSSDGSQLFVQTNDWVGRSASLKQEAARSAVKSIIALQNGKALVHQQKSQPWQIAAYIMAALFAFEMLLMLITMIISSFIRL